EHYRTYLAQPALRWFTQTTLNALVRNPVCVLRRVSGVEVMAPCFSAAALEALLPTFGMTRSTWGTDLAWSGLIGGRQPIHVVDAIGMDHTRSGGGRPSAFYRKLAEMGVDPHEELRSVERLYPQLRRYRTLSSGHVFRDGLPRAVAPALMWLIERLKFIVRIRKRALLHLRYWRGGLPAAPPRGLATPPAARAGRGAWRPRGCAPGSARARRAPAAAGPTLDPASVPPPAPACTR